MTLLGGFEVVPYEEQETGPGLVLVTGGTFVMGRTNKMLLTIGIMFLEGFLYLHFIWIWLR
jgi:hypothetical protein